MNTQELHLQKILDNLVGKNNIFGTTYAIKKGDRIWFGQAGDLNSNSKFFIASTTKLFTTAIIMKLISGAKLRLTDNISKYLDTSIWQGLNIYNDVDYSSEITILHLLSHTSGISDYFQTKNSSGLSLEDKLKSNNDCSWTFEEAIARSKTMKPPFPPGMHKKAHYSDTNFQLLQKIIENIYDENFSNVLNTQIIKPLDLENTYMYADISDTSPKNIYFKSSGLKIPNAMASFKADGGIVSTTKDLLTFIEAFFTGLIFPIEYIDQMKVWNKIFFPLQAGIGIQRFKLPWIFDPFGNIPEIIGHSGLSGALAYYSPSDNIYIVGTVNQIDNPSMSFRTLIKLLQTFKKFSE